MISQFPWRKIINAIIIRIWVKDERDGADGMQEINIYMQISLLTENVLGEAIKAHGR